MKYHFYLILFSILLISCKEKELPENDLIENLPFKTDYKMDELEVSESFESEPVSMGKVSLRESSGLAYSRENPGFLWTIQDKGNNNSIYLIDAKSGEMVVEYLLKGTENRDWESLEISYGPEPEKNYIYIGDTGDNNLEYDDYLIYRFEEPKFEEKHRSKVVELELQIDKIEFEYPQGSYDVEALLVDPHTKDIFLITKRDLYSKLFVLNYPQKLDEMNNAILQGTFSFNIATAGDVSENGNEVLIKTYHRVFIWRRSESQTFTELIQTIPAEAPYQKEEQGEAICFDDKGGYFTLSELSNGIVPDLNYYKRK